MATSRNLLLYKTIQKNNEFKSWTQKQINKLLVIKLSHKIFKLFFQQHNVHSFYISFLSRCLNILTESSSSITLLSGTVGVLELNGAFVLLTNGD